MWTIKKYLKRHWSKIEQALLDGNIYPHWKTIKRFKERVREITARRRGRSISQVIRELNTFTRGWWNYYGITESYNRLRPLAHWIRRRLRAVIWKHWKNRRTRVRELLKRGVTRNYAVTIGCARKGPWRMSKVKWVNIALPDAYFSSLCLCFVSYNIQETQTEKKHLYLPCMKQDNGLCFL